MGDDAEDLFVIDKKGTEESQPSNIVYYFKPEEEQQSGGSSLETKPARQRRGPAGKRYHEADDFNKFRPGHISHELRRALNLDRHEIPLHVYRMRSLGYPPGWLRKAKVGGGLMIFDSVTALAEDKEVAYNRDALISYPGFNAKLEYPYVDQSLQLHCPPMQSHHMLDNFYAALSRSSHWSLNQNDSKVEVPLDLEKLREERERILAEIRLLDPDIIVSQSVHESDDAELQLDREDKEGHSDEHSACRSEESPNPSSSSKVMQANTNPGFGDMDNQILSISASEEGTPTPQRFYCGEDNVGNDSLSSESTKRPSIDAFTVGVQPFRPFENLPGSQGGYQRVLQTLRHSRSLKSLSNHSSDSSNDINNNNSNNGNNNNSSSDNNSNDRSSRSSSNHIHSSNQYVSRNGHHRVSGSDHCSPASQFRGVRGYRYGHHY